MNNLIAKHYDALLSEGNDPVHDPEPLKDYMDKWDGQNFINKMDLDKAKSVLEIGVGTGRLAVRVAPFCRRFVGVDISEKTIEKAKENLKSNGNADLICEDFLNYEFREKYDVVYSSLTFMHIEEKQKAIDKVFSLLNNNGLFVLSIDKNQSCEIDAGFSKISVFPDKPEEIELYIEKAGFVLVEKYETEFAHIFVVKK